MKSQHPHARKTLRLILEAKFSWEIVLLGLTLGLPCLGYVDGVKWTPRDHHIVLETGCLA